MKFGEGESKYLKGSDLGGKSVTVKIDTVTVEEVGQGRDAETKWVLYFIGQKKGMILNVTNQRALIGLFGEPAGSTDDDVSEHFHGKSVELWFDKDVAYAGKRVGGLRLRGVDGTQKPDTKPEPAPAPADESEDEIPF